MTTLSTPALAGVRGALRDSHGRVMRDLRVSVTDRCNFRCLYCLPETEAAANFYRTRHLHDPAAAAFSLKPIPREWKPREALMSFEEIERVARVAVGLGIEKLRITGGEPLLRRGVVDLVGRLARIPGVADLAMTTNGFHFAPLARPLRDAGLRRISFSLDSLDRENFRRMTGRDAMESVLAGIDLAIELGFTPVKVNAVMIRGLNDHELEALAEFALGRGVALRFIEFMPLDSSRAWQRELVVPGGEILQRLSRRFELVPAAPDHPSSTSKRWRFAGSTAEIGVIAPVTEPFCGHCNRLRLTADGRLRTCLFSAMDHDLMPWLREGGDDARLAARLMAVTGLKEEGHHIGRPDFKPPARTMSCIGG